MQSVTPPVVVLGLRPLWVRTTGSPPAAAWVRLPGKTFLFSARIQEEATTTDLQCLTALVTVCHLPQRAWPGRGSDVPVEPTRGGRAALRVAHGNAGPCSFLDLELLEGRGHLIIFLSVHSFISKCVSNAYCLLSSVASSRDPEEDKTHKAPASWSL